MVESTRFKSGKCIYKIMFITYQQNTLIRNMELPIILYQTFSNMFQF